MTAKWSTMDTIFGPFTAVVDSQGAVLASGWTAAADELLALIAEPLRPHETRKTADLGEVSRAVRRYHDGELDATADVPVAQRSGPFREHAWRVLREIPAGKTVSYRDYAALIGRPEAVRAAAAACSHNAAGLFVPCHRVLRGDGSLGGFRWGLELKRQLLTHERS
ncbi:methylated-DNA--[protein]-cysteine S-methyltransferase [Actinopolyspora erythraea]|uniref:Cysteine methyltransferase n=1 Tax=Actinopolyspora erythraea TaxID=414996 RepID=A0A099D117_9ACTN|nr:methylated-DNA--[protein]-cysteine S-methyltransferase [Actinopolyspora erythraea]ASU79858.1 methylated-DNA--[protein]-cysteine S-methyltransferase [Actinopolyspora erythraea]KGI79626.1 cysteine methyltransferase [Actinopolyspora erythraea]